MAKKLQLGKRKRESEPVFPRKKSRVKTRRWLSERPKIRSQSKAKSRSEKLRERKNRCGTLENAKKFSIPESYSGCAWPVDGINVTLSARSSAFSPIHGFQEEPSVQIPSKTPDHIQKLASQAEFAAYELGNVLGAGGFGLVMSATRKDDNMPVALKFVHKSSVTEFKEINGQEIPAEAYRQHRAENHHVISIYEVIDVGGYFVYVMEKPVKCKDMFDIIAERYKQNKTLTEQEVRKYFSQILLANITCEENGILHRDIKPENILIDMSTDEVKLIDFGLSSEVQQEPFTHFRGTPHYMPPEFIQNNQYDGCQGTVWQMGILLVDMLSPVQPAFKHETHAVIMQPRIPQHLSPELKNLIISLLNTNPSNRPTLRQTLQHPWFTMTN